MSRMEESQEHDKKINSLGCNLDKQNAGWDLEVDVKGQWKNLRTW